MTSKLTGNLRYRAVKPFLRQTRLVLQVEVETTSREWDYQTRDSRDFRRTTWRDAKVEDMPVKGFGP